MEQPTPPPSAAEVWAQFPQDPRDPGCAALRASDADRDRVQAVLSEAFADGRLDRDEYDERSTSALAARTLGQLPPLLDDLLPQRAVVRSPGSVPLADASADELRRRATERYQEERRNAFLAFLGPSLICWVIWLATSWSHGNLHPYFPWPIFVSLPTVINAVRVVAGRRDIEARELRGLEKRQAKALQARQQPPGT